MLASEIPKKSQMLTEISSRVTPELFSKASLVENALKSYGRVMVAFSGGVDSALVALMAKLAVGEEAIAVTANSPSLPASELNEAKKLAREIGIKHLIVKTNELEDPNYLANPTNRCYFCKKELGRKLMTLTKELGGYTIVDGTNAEDLMGHRPGAAALTEEGVRRPLAEAGLAKAEVRELARVFSLSNHDKPSSPCLSSRVVYGEIITPERLLRIERAETVIRFLTGVRELRVRDHGSVARIEVGRNERRLFFDEQLLDRIFASLHELGFAHVALELAGYRSGSVNGLSSVRDRKQ